MTINEEIVHDAPTNGHSKGRKVPALPTYFFSSAGVEVRVRRLGPFTMDDIRKSLLKQRKRPVPPTFPVEVGEMRVKMNEPNPNHPAYLQEVREYDNWLRTATGEKMLDLMVNYSIVCEVDPAVVEDKRALLAMIDPALNEEYSDKEVYIRHHLLTSQEDIEGIQTFIMGQSMPTQEAVEEHIESFPGDVQGETSILTPGTPIRVPVQ